MTGSLIKAGFVLCMFWLSACAQAAKIDQSLVVTVEIVPSVTDNLKKERIDLRYVNNTDSTLCFDASGWPSSGGVLNSDGSTVYLSVEGRQFFLEKEQDYCPKCGSELRPGDIIEGFLAYTSFGLAYDLRSKPKKLFFAPVFWQCPLGATAFWAN